MSAVKWHAVVVDNRDPERRFRLKAQVPDFLQDRFGGAQVTSWALPASCGVEYVPEIGDGVWIEWAARNETPHEFIWSGEYASMPGGLSEVINIAQEGIRGNSPYGRGALETTTLSMAAVGGPAGLTFKEPASFQTNACYPDNKVVASPNGKAVLELDGSGTGRVHEQTGQYYREVNGDGVEAKRCTVRMDFVMDREQRLVNGPQTEVINGDVNRQVDGACNVNVTGAARFMSGPLKAKLSSVTIDVDNDVAGLEVTAVGEMVLQAMSALFLAGRSVEIVSASTATLAGITQATVMTPAMAVQVGTTGVDIGLPVAGVVAGLLPVYAGAPTSAAALLAWMEAVSAAILQCIPMPTPAAPAAIAAVTTTMNTVRPLAPTQSTLLRVVL